MRPNRSKTTSRSGVASRSSRSEPFARSGRPGLSRARLRARGARTWKHLAQSVRRSRGRARHAHAGRGLSRAARRASRRDGRVDRGRRGSARRDALRYARTVRASRPHAALRACGRSGRHRARRDRCARSESAHGGPRRRALARGGHRNARCGRRTLERSHRGFRDRDSSRAALSALEIGCLARRLRRTSSGFVLADGRDRARIRPRTSFALRCGARRRRQPYASTIRS